MAVIKPPITGDLVLDSWLNQITQALNTGVVGTSAGGTSQVKSGASGFNTATIYLYARTSTDSAPSAMNEETTYTYKTGVLVNGASHDGVSNGLGPNDVWFRNVPSGAGGYEVEPACRMAIHRGLTSQFCVVGKGVLLGHSVQGVVGLQIDAVGHAWLVLVPGKVRYSVKKSARGTPLAS